MIREAGTMCAKQIPRPTRFLVLSLLALSLLIAGCSVPLLDNDEDGTNDNAGPIETAAEIDDDADQQALADERSPVELAVEQVKPAAVFLAVQVDRVGFTGMPEEGVGSGVIFDEAGYVLTNDHVIADATNISVVLPDGRTFDGTVLGRSPEQDLAIVLIETEDELPVAELGNMEDVRVGQTVIAIGNALGLPGGPTVTTGVVSALGRTIPPAPDTPPMEDLIQTDAAINLGNSGGPLINLDGQVIGVNTARIQQAEGIGFAVSIDTAHRFISQVIEGEPQPFIGISGMDVTPALSEQFGLPVDSGILIVEITPNSPAAEVDLNPGDILIAMDDRDVETVRELQSALEDYEPGDEVILRIIRDGTEQEVELVLGESPIVR